MALATDTPALPYIVNRGGRDNQGNPRSGGAGKSGTNKYRADEPHVGIDFVDTWP